MLELREAILKAQVAVEPDRHRRLGLATSLAFLRFVRLYRKYNPDQPRDELGRWTGGGGGGEGDDDGLTTGTVVTVRKDRVGDPLIDGYTDVLEEKMKYAMEIAGRGYGPWYGTRVHEEFAEAVRNSALPGISVEQSWRDGEAIEGSLTGSVRTDVVLRAQTGEAIAVWDLKTGSGYLPASRIEQLRTQLRIGEDVPIFEIHPSRGTIKKSVCGALLDD